MGHLSDGVATCNEVILSLLSKTRQREREREGGGESKKERKKARKRERERERTVRCIPNAQRRLVTQNQNLFEWQRK